MAALRPQWMHLSIRRAKLVSFTAQTGHPNLGNPLLINGLNDWIDSHRQLHIVFVYLHPTSLDCCSDVDGSATSPIVLSASAYMLASVPEAIRISAAAADNALQRCGGVRGKPVPQRRCVRILPAKDAVPRSYIPKTLRALRGSSVDQ